jgi:hypothetical protein
MSLAPIDEAMRANGALSAVAEMLADNNGSIHLNADNPSGLIAILSKELERSLTAISEERRASLRVMGG